MTWAMQVGGDTLRVAHPDGSMTIIVRHPEWDAIVLLDAPTVKRMSDKRLRRRVAQPQETSDARD